MKNIIVGFIIWGICTVVCVLIGFVFKTSITVLGHVHTQQYIVNASANELTKGGTVNISFVATEENLGAVSLQIKNYNTNEKKDDHKLLFRIKEKGSKEWITEHTYFGGQFHDLDEFPFGFGPIKDSKGKTYIAQIISLDGTQNSKLTLKTSYPTLISYYQFDKHALFSPKNMMSFVPKKLLFALSLPDYVFIIFICYLPFFFYLFILSPIGQPIDERVRMVLGKYLKKYKISMYLKFIKELYDNIEIIPLVLLITGDVFLIKTSYMFITYILIGILSVCLLIKKTTTSFLFKLAFFLLLLTLLISPFSQIDAEEKLIGWAIWIFFISIIYQIIWEKDLV